MCNVGLALRICTTLKVLNQFVQHAQNTDAAPDLCSEIEKNQLAPQSPIKVSTGSLPRDNVVYRSSTFHAGSGVVKVSKMNGDLKFK